MSKYFPYNKCSCNGSASTKRGKIMLLAIALFFATVSATQVSTTKKYNDVDYRLPTNVIPNIYEIRMKTNVTSFQFEGKIKILITAVEETNTITLHAWDVHIDLNSIKITNPIVKYNVVKGEYDTTRHFYTLTLEEKLPKDTYMLLIDKFTGTLNDENYGFYRASYEDGNGDLKWMAITQFGLTGARRAFPCFDEPALKAQVLITIERPKSYKSVANMPLHNTTISESDNDFMIDTYVLSQPMSTYLISFAIMDFGQSGVIENNAIKYSVYARQEAVQNSMTSYALHTGILAMNEMVKYTEISYNSVKMDQMAIPNRFYLWGAMENLGLITYKERRILFHENVSTSAEKQNILQIITHEHAHQWFSNLVSPAWWKYAWLSEGFAKFFEIYAGDKIDSTMNLMDQFRILVVQFAMDFDGTNNTRPMTSNVESPKEIEATFDVITYQKAASVICMMLSFLTEDILKSGLHKYLLSRSYKEATSNDLWQNLEFAIEEANFTHKIPANLSTIMSTWETQSGFPLVKVTRNYETDSVLFEQARFIGKDTNTTDELWYVPINLNDKYGSVTELPIWLSSKQDTFQINSSKDNWIMINSRKTANYYRVTYDTTNWNLIINSLNSDVFQSIDILNKVQIIDDSFELAKAGLLSYDIPLCISKYLIRETNYLPMNTFLKAVKYLNMYLAPTDAYGLFKKHIIYLLENVYNLLGPEIKPTDSHLDRLNREDIIYWLCKYDYADCKTEMNKKLISLEAQVPDMQNSVYCGGVKNYAEWLWLFNELKNEKTDTIRERILNALGCINNRNILFDYTNNITKNDIFDKPDTMFAMEAILKGTSYGPNLLLDSVIENFQIIKSKYTNNEVARIFKSLSEFLTTPSQLEKLSNFSITETNDNITKIVQSAIITVENNIKWSDQHLPSISGWLIENVSNSSGPSGISKINIEAYTLILALSFILFSCK